MAGMREGQGLGKSGTFRVGKEGAMGVKANPACELDFTFCLPHYGAAD